MIQDLEFNIDLKRKTISKEYCKQNDTLNLIFNVYDDGQAVDLSGFTAILNCRIGDKHQVIKNDDITITGNKITIFDKDKYITTMGENATVEVLLSKDDIQKTSFNINIDVDKSVLNSTPELQEVIITAIADLSNKLQKVTENVQTLTELESKSETLKEDLTTINTTSTENLNGLKEENNKVEANLNGLKEENTKATENITVLTNLNTNAETNIDKLNKNCIYVNATDYSTATCITVTIDYITRLEDVVELVIVPYRNCKDNCTIKINNLEEVPIKNNQGELIKEGDILKGIPIDLVRVGNCFFMLKSGGSSNGGSDLNIFQTTTQPTTFKGLWIKSDTKYNIEELKINKLAETPVNLSWGASCMLEDDADNVYILGDTSFCGTNDCFYKYNMTDNEWTKINAPTKGFSQSTSLLPYGNDTIFIVGGSSSDDNKEKDSVWKYTVSDGTSVKVGYIEGYKTTSDNAVIVGNYIYHLNSGKKFNVNTNQVENITPIRTGVGNTSVCCGTSVVINTNIYYIGGSYTGSNNIYKYNTNSDTYTKVATYNGELSTLRAIPIGNEILIIGNYECNKKVIRFKTTSNTFVEQSPLLTKFFMGIVVYNENEDKIFLLSNQYNYKECYKLYDYNTKPNTVYLKGLGQGGEYKTQLYNTSNPDLGVTTFDDIAVTNSSNGIDLGVQVYYGNGTRWQQIYTNIGNEAWW